MNLKYILMCVLTGFMGFFTAKEFGFIDWKFILVGFIWVVFGVTSFSYGREVSQNKEGKAE